MTPREQAMEALGKALGHLDGVTPPSVASAFKLASADLSIKEALRALQEEAAAPPQDGWRSMGSVCALAEFTKRVVRVGCFEGFEVGGESIQEWALELGLLTERPATAEDKETVEDIEVGDPVYRLKKWLVELPAPPTDAEG